MSFCSLHNHTQYSNVRFLDCICKPKDLVDRALSLNYSGIAITDHECLSGSVEWLKIRDSIKKDHPDFKMIFGNEIYLIDKNDFQSGDCEFYHFILLAKDLTGYQQIRELSSRAWERAYVLKGITRVPTFYQDIEEIIGQNPGHVIGTTACLGGLLDKSLLSKDVTKVNWFVNWMDQNFNKPNYYLEIQVSDSQEQKICNHFILDLAKYFEVPYIITTDTHYLQKEDIHIHHCFLNSKDSKERETEAFYKYTYMDSEENMKTILLNANLTDQDIQAGFNNTMKIYDLVVDFDFRSTPIVPECKLPEFKVQHLLSSWYSKYTALRAMAFSQYPQDRYLMYLVEQGIINKNFTVTEKEADRLNTEFDTLLYISEQLKQRLSAYLNVVKTIIDIIWKVSFVGVGRGSSVCFLTNYLIGITQINPLEYDIPYWRFLEKGKVDLPDIDLDLDPTKTEDVMNLLRDYFGYNNVLNCATFKTESLKSAILTGCRGLNISLEDAQRLAALVPISRGHVYTLDECLNGNEEQGYDPVPHFEEALRVFPGLFETITKIEGLSTNASIHASAVYIFNNGYLAQNSLMRAPNKTRMTACNMHDSDDMGALKFDLLRTDCQTKMMKCISLLLKDGIIEWQGSLRATYDKYLHPDVINYTNPQMWADMADGKIPNLFQFETEVGGSCIKRTRPTTVRQLGAANAVMRLVAQDGAETPLDRYVRFRNDISEWYKEMDKYGLNESEKAVLFQVLGHKFGCSVEQEDMMLLVQRPEIAGFTIPESNKLRKGVAKKQASLINAMKEKFFNTTTGARKKFLQYVWDKCIQPQVGYSFSIPHDIAYSIEAVQEANLATFYNSLYWACACLCVNAGSSYSEFDDDVDDDDEAADDVDAAADDGKERSVAPNYGKISRALSNMQHAGVTIQPPDINEAQLDFVPNVDHNSILYSLSTISGINTDIATTIINNRPYTNIQDFINKVTLNKVPMISLIKAGAFDSIEGNRISTMYKYLDIIATQEITKKSKLTATHITKLYGTNVLPPNLLTEFRIHMFKNWVEQPENGYDKTEKTCTINTEDAVKFFKTFYLPHCKPTEIICTSDGYIVRSSVIDKIYKQLVAPLIEWCNSPEGLEKYYNYEKRKFVEEHYNKYCAGTISAWEMAVLNYYYHDHELHNYSGIVNFYNLPEQPSIQRTYEKNSKTINVYQTSVIAGTIVNNDNRKHIVTILTPDGVVDVKFFKNTYNAYNQNISRVDKSGKKTMIEKSWFTRGNLIQVCGIRDENMFYPKYNENKIPPLCLIEHNGHTYNKRYERLK